MTLRFILWKGKIIRDARAQGEITPNLAFPDLVKIHTETSVYFII